MKTKIIATLGPASANEQTITSLIDNGSDIFRLNFSHGSLENHKQTLDMINQVRDRHTHTVAVIGDLCGPKIRTSNIEPDGGEIHADQEITILNNNETGTVEKFGTNYENFTRDVKVGQRILIDDGQLALQVTKQPGDKIVCRVIVGGPLHSHKGINLPDTELNIPSITEHDWRCAEWAIENQLDYLALSFVRTADEIQKLKDYIRKADSDIQVIAKIEKPEAVSNLDDIARVSDALLVARGDLGVEMDLARVPMIQKQITALGRKLGKPVIVATQMLQSMIESPTPTRAEVNDVANAIMDFADTLMLSGETAVGKNPIQAVKTIRQIAQVTEAYLDQSDAPRPKIQTAEELALTAAMARSVAQITDDTDAKLVAVWSQTGSSARLLSKARIDVPILALSSDLQICRQMALHYGVIPRCVAIPEGITELSDLVDELAMQRKWVAPGDQIVIVAGRPLGAAGTTNAIMVHTVTQQPDASV